MEHAYLLWLLPVVYAAHVIEEYEMNWYGWVRHALHLEVSQPQFYLVNMAVLLMGIAAAMIGWQAPLLSLAMPAQMLVNAIFFHVLPTVRLRVFSPGLLTALGFFIPTTLLVYAGAAADGVLTPAIFIGSGILGALVMAFPVLLIALEPRLKYPAIS
jgi:hypothetical protein